MARGKKKAARLPRVTVLAYSRRDLAGFIQAVEKLGLIVNDLAALVPHLRGVAAKPKRGPKAATAIPQPPPGAGGGKGSIQPGGSV